STAMATAAERRSLPSPEIILGQPWSNWVDSAKLHGGDGAESEESFKDLGKNREAMRLCREDMPIFGQCPAQDDFYLVMCSQCSQVVKPQAFQAHYERRHSSLSKPASTAPFPVSGRNRSSGSSLGPGLGAGPGVAGGGLLSRPSTIGSSLSSSSMSSASSNPKLLKPAKEKMSGIQRRPPFAPFRMIQPEKILTPAVKVEKMHLRVDSSAKLVQTPSALATTSSSSLKPGLNCPSIPKPSLMMPGQIPNGKGHLSEKKQDSSSHVSSRRHLNKKLTASEREFNPDIHCGVVDVTTRKPCTRSLTCKVKGLLVIAVTERRLRISLLSVPLQKPDTFHRNLAQFLKRLVIFCIVGLQQPIILVTLTLLKSIHNGLTCSKSGFDKLTKAYCTFGSRLVGRGCYLFDRRWDRVRCALNAMMDKHVNSQLWKKIPLALENSSSAPTHRTSTNSHSSTPSSGFLSPTAALTQTLYSQSYDGKSVLSYGTTLNARSSPQGGAEHPAYGITQARQVSSSPQMPLVSSTTKSSSSSFRPKDFSSGSSASVVPNSTGGGGGGTSANSSSTGIGSGKKRKNSSLLSSPYGALESTNTNYSSSSSSSFRKNCANVGSSGSTYPSSHSGVHSVGLTCGPTARTNSLSLKAEAPGGSAGGSSGPQARGPPSGSPAESIKRMSVVMNSSDSTLSLGPFVHHPSSADHHASFSHHFSDGRLEAKKRKSSPASGGVHGGGGGVGGGGGLAPGKAKVAKSPAINNIHNKHGRSIPGTAGLPNNSHLHQKPKARP
uniref:Ataxin 7 n=1 Tax=Tetraodon nigroviridis TaxID=99883 RepID=H3D0N9_TETNG